MARLADDVINRIKQDVSLLRLVESEGYTVTKQGKDYVVLCPFHDEKTPSCIISPKTNLFNCFGCGTGGSVIDWVMKTECMNFRQACDRLKKEINIVDDQPKVESTPLVPLAADHQAALRDVVSYYHETLKQSPEAKDYLRSRGLDNAELINTFKLGYANKTLGRKLPTRKTKAGCELRDSLQAIGIFRESGHEHFNGSLVVPIENPAGDIAEMYGRKLLGNQLRKGTLTTLVLTWAAQRCVE